MLEYVCQLICLIVVKEFISFYFLFQNTILGVETLVKESFFFQEKIWYDKCWLWYSDVWRFF